MQYVKGIENYQNKNRTAITLGKFDGLHQGHELLVSRVIAHGKQEQVDSVVFAFDMAPFFEKIGKPYVNLLTSKEKAAVLDGRVDYFIDCPFVDSISNLEAEDFIKKVLVDIFRAKYIVVGTDFHFGHNRRGDWEMLKKYSQSYDYEVEVVEKKQYHDREISSTYIKEELQKGNYDLVDELLGYSYQELKKRFDT